MNPDEPLALPSLRPPSLRVSQERICPAAFRHAAEQEVAHEISTEKHSG
jgi:hypothetical protein